MSELAGSEGGEAAAVDTGAETAGHESQAGVHGTGTPATGKEASAARQEILNELGEGDMDKLVTLKINGKEEKMPLKEALKISRLEKVSHAKMQEAAQLQKQAMQMIQMAKSNPRAFFQQTGVDPYEFAEATLAEKFEMMNLSPEQKKMMEYEQKLKSYEEREKHEKMTLEQRQRAEVEAKLSGELETEIVEAWKESGLPRHKYFAARIAGEMLSSHAQKRAGHREEALQAKEAAAIVKNQVVNELREILMSVAKGDPGAAQKMLGDELMKAFRDHDIKRVTGKAASSQSSQNQRPGEKPASGRSSTQNKPLSEKEWNEYFKKL